ncbi:uncharacterized protein [Rutidosis leptorrhynchoides]|uniref:uncharacterized protein n=1 Tax=Rutidosis leptorrhynchoides TaxID=125765 RepID=UPI003A9A2537
MLFPSSPPLSCTSSSSPVLLSPLSPSPATAAATGMLADITKTLADVGVTICSCAVSKPGGGQTEQSRVFKLTFYWKHRSLHEWLRNCKSRIESIKGAITIKSAQVEWQRFHIVLMELLIARGTQERVCQNGSHIIVTTMFNTYIILPTTMYIYCM